MTTKYTNITADEMGKFLDSQGFVPMQLDGTAELVWGKVFTILAGRTGHPVPRKFSVRVYSGIDDSGGSREVGKDAIRVVIFYKTKDNNIHLAGNLKRVHRVVGWRKNLQNRIDNWTDILGPSCDRCGEPMVKRKSKKGDFYGCVTFSQAKCTGTRKI